MLFFLGKGYRVIAHDRRGHGRSTQTGERCDVRQRPQADLQLLSLHFAEVGTHVLEGFLDFVLVLGVGIQRQGLVVVGPWQWR